LAKASQRGELRLAQHQTLLRTLGFQCLEPLLHGLELVALPHAAHPSRRHTQPAPPQFIGNPYLTPGGCSIAHLTTASSTSGATRFFNTGQRREISCSAAWPPLS
jgi:hypothetical protein